MAVLNHVLYLTFSAAFTFGVGRSLYQSGKPFLMECFQNELTADVVNRLFLIGFYLMNFAFVLVTLRLGETGTTVVDTIETLGTRVGAVVMTMGVMHFNNLYWCARIKRALPPKATPSLAAN